MSDALDTTIHEPPFGASEVAHLLFSVDRSRATLAWKVGGLSTDELHQRSVPSSAMTLGGMMKHLALCEEYFVAQVLRGETYPEPWKSITENPWDWCWTSALSDSAEELSALWGTSVARAREAWLDAIGDGGLDQSTKLVVDGVHATLRRALVDLSDEYARHLGHADLLREAIDGLTGEDPPRP